MSDVAVLGGGIVGSAAAWDLGRRGHNVTVFDVRTEDAAAAAALAGGASAALDVTDGAALRTALGPAELVVSAVPYALGMAVARAAVETGTHYLDFGGNPSVVADQLTLNDEARATGVAVVPDCGLAPGMANVLAVGAVDALGDGPIDEVQIRVGALPSEPVGALGYQLAFNPAGLINEYAEPCEVLADGEYATVEPLTGFEEVAWEGWGPLEAFHTAGGSSSLPRLWQGRVAQLDYKTLRFPGHGHVFRALLELGMFDESPQPGTGVPPRSTLLEALAANLPRGEGDLVLVRVWARAMRNGRATASGYEVEDTNDELFSALARTTAFPATALADLLLAGEVATRGALTMDHALPADMMISELAATGIAVTPFHP